MSFCRLGKVSLTCSQLQFVASLHRKRLGRIRQWRRRATEPRRFDKGLEGSRWRLRRTLMGFQCRFFTPRPIMAWPIGVFDRRVSAVRQVRWHSGGDSPLHKERLWALGAHWWEDVLEACRWSGATPLLYELSKLARSNTARATKAYG